MAKFNSSIRKDFFENIDSEEKAYWLGYLISDGSIEVMTANSSRVSLCLNGNDKNHLYKLKESMLIDNKVSEKTYIDKRCKKPIYRAQLKFSNPKIIKDLANYGVVPKKTGKEFMPEVPHELKKHLIRGYFDGDGWIRKEHKTIGFVASNNQVVNYIQSYLKEELGIVFKTIDETHLYKSGVINCNINKRKDAWTVIDFLYGNSNIYLDRKKKLADEVKLLLPS